MSSKRLLLSKTDVHCVSLVSGPSAADGVSLLHDHPALAINVMHGVGHEFRGSGKPESAEIRHQDLQLAGPHLYLQQK